MSTSFSRHHVSTSLPIIDLICSCDLDGAMISSLPCR